MNTNTIEQNALVSWNEQECGGFTYFEAIKAGIRIPNITWLNATMNAIARITSQDPFAPNAKKITKRANCIYSPTDNYSAANLDPTELVTMFLTDDEGYFWTEDLQKAGVELTVTAIEKLKDIVITRTIEEAEKN